VRITITAPKLSRYTDDCVSAYVRFSLAASAEENLGVHQLKKLARLMTPRQLQEAHARLSNRRTRRRSIDQMLPLAWTTVGPKNTTTVAIFSAN
jgi:hypothetical protein